MAATFSEIERRIQRASRILVVSHDRPDGDAIGSVVATGMLLEKLGKEVELVNFDRVPESLAFLPGSERIESPRGRSEADLVIALDSAGRDRINEAVWEFASAIETVVNIDHHVSNTEFGTLNYVDGESPATGQIVFQLAASAGWEMDREIAENLYAAISTDTGSFRYPSTTSETYRIVATLTDLGVDVGRINQLLYENYPERRVQLLRVMLQNMRMDFDGRCASLSLPIAISKTLELAVGDTEGVIDVVRAIDTVIVAILFEELPDGRIRVSSRSKDPRCNVGEICAEFGGGGHALAAGARLPGPLQDARERFLAHVSRKLETF
ncbi:MAG: bifunctional oligoribonuclease/PAP phosphatase NrnA [Verrucomicrobiales bacterium]